MIEKFKLTIPELTGRKKRRAYIYLPTSYEEEPDRHYPVLYMFDGQNVFFDEDATYGKSWGLGEYLDYMHIPLIVAAVESNNNAYNGRIKEYAPFSFNDYEFGWIRGKGQMTMDWLVNEFKPQVDVSYRTMPFRETTFIAGSSMGGLMTLYALTQYNDYFGRGAALSPSLECGPRRILNMVREAELNPDTLLYMDMGAKEFEGQESLRPYFARTASEFMYKGCCVDVRIIPEGVHTEASWEQQEPFFINTLMYGYGEA